jgi:hypothetical protein
MQIEMQDAVISEEVQRITSTVSSAIVSQASLHSRGKLVEDVQL